MIYMIRAERAQVGGVRTHTTRSWIAACEGLIMQV